jgi:hypothetical protein
VKKGDRVLALTHKNEVVVVTDAWADGSIEVALEDGNYVLSRSEYAPVLKIKDRRQHEHNETAPVHQQ